MTAPPLPDVILEPIVRLALLEDLAPAGDITSDSAVSSAAALHAVLRARQAGVVAGLMRRCCRCVSSIRRSSYRCRSVMALRWRRVE
jgi:nicotinate-nucleotide pyrophosphorylase